MRRKTKIYILAVDVDPVPGGMDNSRQKEDIESVLRHSIAHYNPVVRFLGDVVRPSNFMDSVTVPLSVTLCDLRDIDTEDELIFDGDVTLDYIPEHAPETEQ